MNKSAQALTPKMRAVWEECQKLNTVMPKNKAAQQLGRLARGKSKTYSAAELEARTERLKQARAKLAKMRKGKHAKL